MFAGRPAGPWQCLYLRPDPHGHLYEPLDEIAADRLEQLIADAIARRTRTEPELEL